MGKGDRRLHDRRQCSDTVMSLRWKLAFDSSLSDEERKKITIQLEELKK